MARTSCRDTIAVSALPRRVAQVLDPRPGHPNPETEHSVQCSYFISSIQSRREAYAPALPACRCTALLRVIFCHPFLLHPGPGGCYPL